ncbi:MAG: LPS export ABC transporter periplasmic protein LptC [Steroidobacteraceae bacterium]|jgi:LPS export ABC transporter protein LptC
MILRLLFALGSLAILGALLYFQDADNAAPEGASADVGAAAPGYSAVHAELIETGEDGRPLYRLNAERIEQPQPQGTVFLTDPKLDYEPEKGNPWTLTAQSGQMPQDAHTAELHGDVHAEGKPTGSGTVMRINTEDLHLDMTSQLATSPTTVRVDWGGYRLDGRGMRADLKNDRLQLASKVRGVLLH